MARSRYQFRPATYQSHVPVGVKWLIIINVAVFLACYLGREAVQGPARAFLGLSAVQAISHFMVWQVFTYMFVHFGVFHVLFNMLGLWFFGVPIERDWGTRRFLKFYTVCGVVAGICVLAATVIFARDEWTIPTIGASGAIFGILVAFGVLYPETIILIFFLFPMKAKYAVMIFVAIELLATLGPNTGVSTVAHLGGAACGFVYLKSRIPSLRIPDWRARYRQWKLQRAKKKFQVYMRKHGGGGPWVN